MSETTNSATKLQEERIEDGVCICGLLSVWKLDFRKTGLSTKKNLLLQSLNLPSIPSHILVLSKLLYLMLKSSEIQ
jgi:hypothetical protein